MFGEVALAYRILKKGISAKQKNRTNMKMSP